MNKNELEVYEYQQMQRMIRENAETTAKNDGKQEARLDIARNLLDLLDDATIAQKTGLNLQTVSQLRSQTA